MPTSIAHSTRATVPGSAGIALALAIAFVVLVGALHGVRADLSPRGHVLSEYSLGPGGWMMALAFFALAGSFVALLVALWPSLSGWRGGVGRVALAVAAIGAAMGGLFPMDPIGTPPEQASTTAQLHNLAFMLGGPGALLAITFVNWALARRAEWQASRSMLAGSAALAWLAMVAFFVAVSLLMSDPLSGDRAIGAWNRLLVVSWVIWVVALGLYARRR